MPLPCRSPAMPSRWRFRMCLSHLIYAVRPCLIRTCHAASISWITMPFFALSRHSVAAERGPFDQVPAFGFFRLSRRVPRICDPTHSNLRCSWPVWNQISFALDEERVVAAHYKKDDLLHTSVISGYHADFHEWHTLSEQGRGAEWRMWINAQHGMGTACTRRGIGMLCVNRPL